jgi:hypothetical protein
MSSRTSDVMNTSGFLEALRVALQDTTLVSAISSAPQSSAATANVSDHGSKTLATVALVIGAVAVGMIVMLALLAPLLLNAAGAKAEATAHVARTQALVALDKVEDLRVKLAAKGIDLPPLDGH